MPYRRYTAVRSRLAVGLALTVAAFVGAAGLWNPAGAAGTAYFVSPIGADTNSGTSAAAPFKTIQKALDLAQPGTTITLAAGSYREAVATKVAGTAGAPITIRGPETGKAVGGRYKATVYSPAGRVVSINHSYYTIDGFTIDGQPDIARTEYPTTLAQARSFKDSVQKRAINSKLVYVGAAATSADIVGTTISNMFLNGSGGECVRFRNRAASSTVVNSVIQWCGMLGQGDGVGEYKYHNAEGVYVGTSPKSTDQPMAANDSSNNIVVKNSTINTFGSECFEVKENAHHNRLESSDCGFNDEPLSFKGSNIELRGDHNVVAGNRVTGSRSWNVKLMSDAPSYDRGGNTVERTSFDGAAGAAIHSEQSMAGSSFCGNTFATTPVSDGSTNIGDPRKTCADTAAPTAPAGLTASAASATSVALSWTAATDDVGVTAYGVLRGGVQVATTPTTSYTDSGLTASTAYSYTVVARDAAGNTSPASAAVPVTTPAVVPPTTTPTTPTTAPPTTAPPTTAPPTTVPPTTAPPGDAQAIVKEAEAGTVTSPMAVRTDSAAQGGRYVSQTSGSSTGKITVQLTVPKAGRYAVALRVITPNTSSDSFIVKVGSGAAATWSLPTRTMWTWVTGPTTVQLPAGTTTVVVTNRENGTRLDAVRLAPAP